MLAERSPDVTDARTSRARRLRVLAKGISIWAIHMS